MAVVYSGQQKLWTKAVFIDDIMTIRIYWTRAGHLEFTVLQCNLKSYFRAYLTMKMTYFWASLIKMSYPQSKITKSKSKNLEISRPY